MKSLDVLQSGDSIAIENELYRLSGCDDRAQIDSLRPTLYKLLRSKSSSIVERIFFIFGVHFPEVEIVPEILHLLKSRDLSRVDDSVVSTALDAFASVNNKFGLGKYKSEVLKYIYKIKETSDLACILYDYLNGDTNYNEYQEFVTSRTLSMIDKLVGRKN